MPDPPRALSSDARAQCFAVVALTHRPPCAEEEAPREMMPMKRKLVRFPRDIVLRAGVRARAACPGFPPSAEPPRKSPSRRRFTVQARPLHRALISTRGRVRLRSAGAQLWPGLAAVMDSKSRPWALDPLYAADFVRVRVSFAWTRLIRTSSARFRGAGAPTRLRRRPPSPLLAARMTFSWSPSRLFATSRFCRPPFSCRLRGASPSHHGDGRATAACAVPASLTLFELRID